MNRREKFLAALGGEAISPPPLWFMRQAGRYLPEYRATRAEAGSFLDLCYDSEKAAEVTYQPIRRYDTDAAILFADILLIPDGLGQGVSFVQGEGPKLFPPLRAENFDDLSYEKFDETLSPIYETVRQLRAGLGNATALIGFAGAPWTVATYMIGGGTQRDPSVLRRYYYDDPSFVDRLISLLVEATAKYLIKQADAGADAIQLFDTWAGGLPEDLTRRLSLEPMARIAEMVRSAHPEIPFILFPKGVGPLAKEYAGLGICDGIGIDTGMPWDWARDNLSPLACVQGGLDPLLVVAGGAPMHDAARRLKETFHGTPYIFNLGHGFVPETPPAHVAELVDTVRSS
ncbi:MAG: uroporphyrinogen decarboxylase [Parvularculaceae bacterium]|nr:MAG: uroporphyrinogen decarboxylase [Parvularculaceae bacterium]